MKCRYCKNEIPEAAALCAQCRLYQASWRNWLPYIGGVVAVLTLIGSLSGYLVTVWTDLYSKYLAGDDIAILSFKSSGRQLYLNRGGQDVYVSHVVLASDEGNVRKVSRPSLTVPAGLAASHDAGEKKDGDKPAAEAQILSLPRTSDGLQRFKTSTLEDRRKCVRPSFYSVDDPAYVTFLSIFEKSGHKLVDFPATANVVYYNWKGERREKSFDARLLFSLVQNDDCKKWLGQWILDGKEELPGPTSDQWPDLESSVEPDIL